MRVIKIWVFCTSSNDDKSITPPFQSGKKILNFGQSVVLIVILRQFKVDENTLKFFKMYFASADNVIKEHEQLYSYVEGKMKTLRLGLKSYRTLIRQKHLQNKVGVVFK
ncbi:MAG: hypothetical protein CM15mV67_030 [uncultured marine virus]|nr:MAG: hypothetical protein CM15mV67_030 [uncultured marine virus]